MTPNGNGHTQRDPISPGHDSADYKYGRFDASALHIAHALKQTEIQKSYNKCDKPINLYLVSVKIFAELMYSLAIAHQSKLEILKLSTCNLCSFLWRRMCQLCVYHVALFLSPTSTHSCDDYDWEKRWKVITAKYKISNKNRNANITIDG